MKKSNSKERSHSTSLEIPKHEKLPNRSEAKLIYSLSRNKGQWITNLKNHNVYGLAGILNRSPDHIRKVLLIMEGKGWVRSFTQQGDLKKFYKISDPHILAKSLKVLRIKPIHDIITCPHCGTSFSTVLSECPNCKRVESEAVIKASKTKPCTDIVPFSESCNLPSLQVPDGKFVREFRSYNLVMQTVQDHPPAVELNVISRKNKEKKAREASRFGRWAKTSLLPQEHIFLPVLVDHGGNLVGEEFWEERALAEAKKPLSECRKFFRNNGGKSEVQFVAAQLLDGARVIVEKYGGVKS